jgi:hypothetical protein
MKEVVDALMNAPEFVNPAIRLAAEVLQLEAKGHRDDVEKLLRSVEVEKAIIAGERETNAVMASLAACGHSVPVPSNRVPTGF